MLCDAKDDVEFLLSEVIPSPCNTKWKHKLTNGVGQ